MRSSLNYWAGCMHTRLVSTSRRSSTATRRRALPGVDHKLGEAATWDHLGYAYRGLPDLPESVACYRRALNLYEELNDLYYQARMLKNLGDVQAELGDEEAASAAWQASLDLLTDLNHPNAEAVDNRLRGLGY